MNRITTNRRTLEICVLPKSNQVRSGASYDAMNRITTNRRTLEICVSPKSDQVRSGASYCALRKSYLFNRYRRYRTMVFA